MFKDELEISGTWECSVMCDGYTNKGDSMSPPSEINICDFLCPQSCEQLSSFPLSFMFDPKVFHGVNSKENLKLYLKGKCREAGFFLTTDNRSKGARGGRLSTISFICEHNKQPMKPKTLDKNATKVSRRGRVTTRPLSKSHRCPFEFKVTCLKEDQCWYLVSHDRGPTHVGHYPQVPDTVRSVLESVDENLMELALHSEELGLSDATIAALLNLQGSGTERFTRSQIRHLLTRHKADSAINGFGKKSSAEALLSSFDSMIENGYDLHYVAMVHSCDQSFQLKIPKGRPRKITLSGDIDIDKIRLSMRINDNQEVLLAFAWITGEELQMVSKFPEMIIFDGTEQTNKEKRSLFVGTGQDGNNKIFLALHSFMPNSQMSAFHWIYEYAIPCLWSLETITNNDVVITDGEDALYGPLENLSNTGTEWSGTLVMRLVL